MQFSLTGENSYKRELSAMAGYAYHGRNMLNCPYKRTFGRALWFCLCTFLYICIGSASWLNVTGCDGTFPLKIELHSPSNMSGLILNPPKSFYFPKLFSALVYLFISFSISEVPKMTSLWKCHCMKSWEITNFCTHSQVYGICTLILLDSTVHLTWWCMSLIDL